MKMKFCPRLLIFELLDCTLGIFRGYDFSIFKILLFLDRYFGVFYSDLRASPPCMFNYGVPPWDIINNYYTFFGCNYDIFSQFLLNSWLKKIYNFQLKRNVKQQNPYPPKHLRDVSPAKIDK